MVVAKCLAVNTISIYLEVENLNSFLERYFPNYTILSSDKIIKIYNFSETNLKAGKIYDLSHISWNEMTFYGGILINARSGNINAN
jgi:hypothetical protein